jgi:magnesium-transporting ATPase (P-type)
LNIIYVQKFAGEGLRTLALAERHIDQDFFNKWRKKQKEAALSLDGREDKLGEVYEEIECDMQLVGKYIKIARTFNLISDFFILGIPGVTAIEDKLQDGVPQTIANLQMAGIKVWVLTGDKQG